jgi:3-hydroxymyristoyl/3-hydroxydecanoyl-(acyl carrier protein) dehydratase
VYDGSTVFGFFPPAAFERQAGVGSTPEQRARLDVVSAGYPVAASAPPSDATRLRIPTDRLRMIDRVCAVAPDYVRTEKTVDTRDWYFRAHFYEDPVQPGSLGVEAMVQALQWLAAKVGADEGMRAPRFQALAPRTSHAWRYRGQVVPTNRRVDVEVSLVSTLREPTGVTLTAQGALWVDGLRIYTCDGLSVRVVDDG